MYDNIKFFFFKNEDSSAFGGRFLNTTAINTNLLTLRARPKGEYPEADVSFGSSEQMYHFLKVVDYVNNLLGFCNDEQKIELIKLANELKNNIVSKNSQAFLPRIDWDPILKNFINDLKNNTILRDIIGQSGLLTSDDPIKKWNNSLIDSSGGNYNRMVKALELKMEVDTKFRQDMKTCLEQGIFPVEMSIHDSVWATGRDGLGQNQLGIALLDAANNYFTAKDIAVTMHSHFVTCNFKQIFSEARKNHNMVHDSNKLGNLYNKDGTTKLELPKIPASTSNFTPGFSSSNSASSSSSSLNYNYYITTNHNGTKLCIRGKDGNYVQGWFRGNANSVQWTAGRDPNRFSDTTQKNIYTCMTNDNNTKLLMKNNDNIGFVGIYLKEKQWQLTTDLTKFHNCNKIVSTADDKKKDIAKKNR